MSGLAILGTGGYTLPVVENEELLKSLKSPKDSGWLTEKTGIRGHSLNFNPKTRKKITNENSLDYAEHAAREALKDAGIGPDQVNHLCLATCTPAQNHFQADAIELHRRFGFNRDIILDQVNGGCAALAKVFQLAETHSRQSNSYPDFYTLIVASNDVASFINTHRYRSSRGDNAWLSPAIFADGAGALVLGPGTGHSLIKTYSAVDGDHPLVTYLGGGADHPTKSSNLNNHAYVMDAQDVALQFLPGMERALKAILSKQNITVDGVQRWYLHQANFRFIEKFAEKYRISMDKIPHNVDRIGNTVSASTLLLLNEDMKNEKFPVNGPVIFLFVGAGMMEGGALFCK